MLDTETKRRIDTARDILVGKVPDPKSQVEQITIALIYKFMADMDAESEELNGQRTFFSGEFEKYTWSKLLAKDLSGYEMLNLFSEALQRMNENPNIPKLFRDIFKNAYLPYRDPETLRAFLKVINEFVYDHSERLGDAFEYLLSVLGSQGDAGQFRTPRHLIDFMVEIINPKKNDTILDPACGTAGFLISAYKHIIKHNSSDYTLAGNDEAYNQNAAAAVEITSPGIMKYKGDKLTPDERIKLIENIKGYDISPDMVRLSLVNLYLHGFVNPKISEYDTLTSMDNWNEYADVILANPPFMSPKGGIKPHKKFSVESKRSEVLFVDYMLEHLTANGRAAIIVPEGIIFQSGKAYKTLRKMLVENYLFAVVSLPAGVFNPYSGVKTSILLIDKSLSKKTDKILFVKIENDGFDLGAQRRANNKSELPVAINYIKEYIACIQTEKFYLTENRLNINIVSKEQISSTGTYNLSGERYKVPEIISCTFPLVALSELCSIIGGGTPSKQNKEYWDNGTIKWLACKYISDQMRVVGHELITEKGLNESSTKLVPIGSTILVTRVSVGKYAYADDNYAINQDLTALIPNDKIYNKYLHVISSQIAELINSNAQGIGVRGVTKDFISNIKIPLPPITLQKEIVAEIEGYQKIIDGARQVVENYKPQIPIDPSWPMVELGKICEINPKKSELSILDRQLEVSFVPMAHIGENQMYFQSKESKRLNDVYTGYTYFRENDVLLAKVTPCFENGKSGIAVNLLNGIGFGSSELFVLRAKSTVKPQWVYYNIITNNFRKNGKLRMTGTGGLQRVPKEFIESYKIPIADINIQQQIIETIEKELEIISANRELIISFEQKIKTKIGSIWGEQNG